MKYIKRTIINKISKVIGFDKKILDLTDSYNDLDVRVKNIINILKLQNDENKDLNKQNIYLNNELCNLRKIFNTSHTHNVKLTADNNELIKQLNKIKIEREQFNIFKKNMLSDLHKKNIKIKILENKIKNFNINNETQANELMMQNKILSEKLKLYMNISITEKINLPLLLQSIINSEIAESQECGDEPLLHMIDFKNGDGKHTLFNHSEKLYNKLLNIGKNKGLKMGTQLGYCDVCIIFGGNYKEDIDIMYNLIKCTNRNISIDEFVMFISRISKNSLKKIFNCYIK